METSLLGRIVTRIWLLLAALTALSWWLGLDTPSTAAVAPRWLAAGLLILAFFKVRLVILYFMEIRSAPRPIRLVFEAWVIGVCASLIAIYWMGGAPT